MKKFQHVCPGVLVLALASSLSFGQPAGFVDEWVPLPSSVSRRIAVGMTRAQVRVETGPPEVRLDANVWIYWDFRIREIPADKNHDALLVVFENDRVRFFKFTASEPVRAFIAKQKGAPAVAVK